MRGVNRWLAPVGCMLGLVLAGPHVVAAPSAPASYFPLKPGTTWTYRTNITEDVVMRVGALALVGSRECRVIETTVGGTITQRECYSVKPDGVYAHERRYPAGTLRLDPPQRMLAAPVAVGQAWSWTGRIGDELVRMRFTWARAESVSVPAGTYETMQLYFDGAFPSGTQIQSWRWFASGIGMVKEDSIVRGNDQMLRVYAELLSVTVPK